MYSKKRSILATAVVLSLGAGAAQAATTTNNNFTMLDSAGMLVGGTNSVVFTWDGTLNTDPNTAVSNASLVSSAPFFGLSWTAHNVKLYGAGSYTLSTADVLGSADCPTMANCVSGGSYNVTVAPGQVMAHMKFAWGATQGIDVVNVWEAGDWTSLNPGNPIFTGQGGANGTYIGPYYQLTSIDWDGNGIAGAAMIDGPFQGFNANFNVNAVPVPAAVWLFGSGLLGLIGVARRKKKN